MPSGNTDRAANVIENQADAKETHMLKFYYSGAPNPTKVALFLEETGTPYEPIPIDQRRAAQTGICGHQCKRQAGRNCGRGRYRFRFERYPTLSRGEDRQISAR